MTHVMQELHTDHRHFAKLLNVAADELAMLKRGEMPDFNLVLDMLDYIESYADLYHHPREDAIYQLFLGKGDVAADAREQIDVLFEQHEDLRAKTDSLRRTVEGLLHDAIVSKDDLVRQLDDFIQQQRRHLRQEESTVFPLLKERLTAEDWERIDKQAERREDPLFGKEVAAQFEALYQRIANAT